MYGFDPYIRTMYGPDIPYNPYIVATLQVLRDGYGTVNDIVYHQKLLKLDFSLFLVPYKSRGKSVI